MDFKKTIIATLCGAALGILAPWPGLGPLMSALYVKTIEKGLVMGKKAIDIHFPHNENDKELEKGRGVNVVVQQSRGVEVAFKSTEAEKMSAAVREVEDRRKAKEFPSQVTARFSDIKIQENTPPRNIKKDKGKRKTTR